MTTEILGREALRSRPGGVWAYLSPSRLNCWLACPLKFRFQYIDGLRPPASTSLFLGKVVHAGLEIWYRGRERGTALQASDVARQMRDSWEPWADAEGMIFATAERAEALQQQAVDLVLAYLQEIPAEEPRPLAVEAAYEAPLVDPFSGEDLGIPIVGVMDLVLDGQEGPVICDFKTSARSAEPLEIVHEIQLSSYAYLFRQRSPCSEAGLEIRSLVKTKIAKADFHRYPARTDQHFRRLFALIRAYLDDLDAGWFTFRPGFHCGMCDFRQTYCRGWQG